MTFFSRRNFLKASTLGAFTLGCHVHHSAFAGEKSAPKFGLVTFQWAKDWDLTTIIKNCELTSSTRPIRDSGLKPASWSPTSEASKSGNQDHKGGSWISSPRRITKPQNQQTQTQTVKPAPVRQAAPTPRKIQPAKPESPGFYKRSVSRFKSLFKDD